MKFLKTKYALVVVALTSFIFSTAASAAITMPTVSYTDINAAATTVLEVVVAIMLIKAAKALFR